MTEPTETLLQQLETTSGAIHRALAQLRHAYTHGINGTIGDPKSFATGLLAPAIRELEYAETSTAETLRQISVDAERAEIASRYR